MKLFKQIIANLPKQRRSWFPSSSTVISNANGEVSGVATDAQGRIYLFQRANPPVVVLASDGTYLNGWGEGIFTSPHGCRFAPDGTLWLIDWQDHRVMQFSSEGRILAAYGTKGKPGVEIDLFNQPTDIAFSSSGYIYIADGYGNSRVVCLNSRGDFVRAWGRRGCSEGEFRIVHSIAVDKMGRVYVADRQNARIQVFTPDGKFITQWRHIGHPYSLFISPDQKLFVADGRANSIAVYDLDGRRLIRWGRPGAGEGQMQMAHMLCVHDKYTVYVAEVTGRRVQKFVLDQCRLA